MNPSPERTLAVQTYLGSSIPNHIDAEPTPNIVALAKEGAGRLLLASVKQIGPPTGRYNCHGLVLACRRTSIPPVGEPVDIDSILREDQMRPIQGPPQVGDVAVYRTPGGEIDHTGIVCRIDRLAPGALPTIFVWSMWGGLGEFEHEATRTPYHECAIEYWRLS